MPDIRIFPEYKVPEQRQSQFVEVKSDLNAALAFAEADLAASGLTIEDMGVVPDPMRSDHYDAQYYIPYFYPSGEPCLDPSGDIRMFRRRGRLTSAGVEAGRGKYSGPSRKEAGNLTTIPYIHPRVAEYYDGRLLAICEGEKKAACLLKYAGIAAIAIGGKDNWHPAKAPTVLHPMIQAVLEEYKPEEVLVIPDGDVRKYHIAQSYGGLARCLQDYGYNVRMALLPEMEDKLDDLLVANFQPDQDEEVRAWVEELPNVDDWVEPLARLRDVYHLQVVGAGDRARVPTNETNLTALIRNHPSFEELWHNEDSQRTYMGDRLIDDHEVIGVLGEVQRRFSMSGCRKGMLHDVLEHVARRHKSRSPWREYLSGLTWDGKDRLGTWLLDYCNARDTELAREGGLKWMVGAVGRAMTPGCKVDYMLVTTGPQGVGKSSIPTILFKRGQVRTIASHLSEVDMYTAMHGSHCANWEELAAMSKYELDHFKIVVTETHDTFRRKYGRSDETRARDFVLYGSTNNANFLPPDGTGHRRYVVAEVGQVEFKQLERDVDQLWAEAYALWEGGQVDFSQVQAARESASQYVRAPNEYDTLLERIVYDYQKCLNKNSSAVGEVTAGTYRCVMGDIRELAGLSVPKGRAGQEMNDYLRGLGWELVAQGRINGRKRSKLWSVPCEQLDQYI
jgi:hypothetical protein